MPRLAVAAAIGTLAAAASAQTPPQAADPVLSRGLTHTEQDRPLIESAVRRANLLLAGSGRALRVAASDRADAGPASAVPVYLVAAPPGAATTPAAVPRGCVCIFFNPASFAAWLKPHTEGDGRLSLDASYLLTFMLLHEAGHIDQGSAGGDFADGSLSQLNIEPSRAKAAEEDADQFAADLIRKHASQVSNSSLDANWVATQLSSLSWNMQAYISLDQFGSTAIGAPAVFFDHTYSHPNLVWRVLRVNHLIQQRPETKALLDAFEDARRRGAEQRPIYQKK